MRFTPRHVWFQWGDSVAHHYDYVGLKNRFQLPTPVRRRSNSLRSLNIYSRHLLLVREWVENELKDGGAKSRVTGIRNNREGFINGLLIHWTPSFPSSLPCLLTDFFLLSQPTFLT